MAIIPFLSSRQLTIEKLMNADKYILLDIYVIIQYAKSIMYFPIENHMKRQVYP